MYRDRRPSMVEADRGGSATDVASSPYGSSYSTSPQMQRYNDQRYRRLSGSTTSGTLPSSPNHSPGMGQALQPESPSPRSVAQSVAEERLKRSKERMFSRKHPPIEQLKQTVHDERLFAIPERKLRAFLIENGVPRKAMMNANWFWLRAEAALKYNVDLEPLLSELGSAKPPPEVKPEPPPPSKEEVVRRAAERAAAAAERRTQLLALERRERELARGKGSQHGFAGKGRGSALRALTRSRSPSTPTILSSSSSTNSPAAYSPRASEASGLE